MYIIFDTETNGKPKDFNAKMSNVDNWPRITQLGYQVYNNKKELIKEVQHLVIPDGWEIPKEKFFIDNNMSTDRCLKYGKPIKEVLTEFINDLESCIYLVAHNIQFDYNVVGAELIRLGLKSKNKPQKVCTMLNSMDVLKIPNTHRYSQYKWPNLTELHKYFFGTGFDGAHDAMDDVRATAKCYFKLIENEQPQ